MFCFEEIGLGVGIPLPKETMGCGMGFAARKGDSGTIGIWTGDGGLKTSGEPARSGFWTAALS